MFPTNKKLQDKSELKTEENPNKNRGYFSEKATHYSRLDEDVGESLQDVSTALICPMQAWSTQTERYSPILESLPASRRENYLEPAQKWIRYPGKVPIVFPVQAIKPKVQRAHDTSPGHLPREVEMDRRRRKYAKMNIQDLLIDAGIDNFQLIPVHVMDTLAPLLDENQSIFNKSCLFPLEWFDNRDFDPMTPFEWLQLGYVDGIKHPIPAEAFLPNRFVQDNLRKKNLLNTSIAASDSTSNAVHHDRTRLKNHLYTWTKVAVKNYDPHSEKWIVTNLETAVNYKIPRIYLRFTAENPQDFVKRLQFAVSFREKSERSLKFEVIVDCMQLTGLPVLSSKMMKRMHKLARNTDRVPNAEWLEDLENQVKLNYQRIQATMDFKANVLKHPDDYHFVDVPRNHCLDHRSPVEAIGKQRFSELQQLFKKNTIFYVQQSISAMFKVASECEIVDKQSLFMLSTAKTSSLKDFVSTQQYSSNTVAKYLNGSWLEKITGEICMQLRMVGKGWLDITIDDWGVYKVSKIFRFLLQVKFRMQDALHRFLEQSILEYSKFLCDACEVMLGGSETNFIWKYPFNFSPFKPKISHVFILSISMTDSGARFSTDPDEFRPVIVDILEEALLQSCGIHQVDPNVMSSLIFRNDLYLKSAVLVEDLFDEHRAKLTKMFDLAVIPLKAYGKNFDEFIPLHLLNVSAYVNEFFLASKTPYDVKEEILLQMRMRDRLEEDLPKTIVIGPFMVNVDPMKQILTAKTREIIKRHLEAYTGKIFRKTEALIDQFQQVMSKVSEKAASIEHVFAICEYAQTVPESVAELSEALRLLISEYDILDYFWHSLSNEQFALKWEVIGWPHKILKYLDILHENQEYEIEDFKKIQINDVIQFNYHLDALNDEILKYSLMFDPARAPGNAADIKKTWKIVMELEKQRDMLRQRQALFELSEMDLYQMEDLVENIRRYKSLWYSCADILKHEEIAYGNNLVNLDVHELKAAIATLQDNLKQALTDFSDHQEIADVAQHYLDLIDKLQPTLRIIECVRSSHWSIIHWQELAKRAELDMKFSLSINFKYCANKGILNHLPLIEEIWKRSKYEADLEAQYLAEEELRKQEEELRKQEEAEALMKRKMHRKCRTDI